MMILQDNIYICYKVGKASLKKGEIFHLILNHILLNIEKNIH